MVRYRRNRVQGGTFFFTVTLRERHSDLLVRRIGDLKAAWKQAGKRVAHHVVAAVVLPDHLHAVITMGEGSCDYSGLWRDIKKGFTRRVVPDGRSPWQARFWEHTIRDADDLAAHVAYVHINPMRHGLVKRVQDWPHSTFHRHVREGTVAADWAWDDVELPLSSVRE